MNYDIIFESQRISYIQMSELFLNDYLKMWNNQEIQKTLIKEPGKIFTNKQILEWINRKIEKEALIFTMIEKSTKEYIGIVEIINIRDNIGEIAITVVPEKQNNHFGTETMISLMNYLSENTKIKGFDLHVKKDNKNAIHLYEKVGFTFDGDGYTESDVHMTK